MAYTTKGKVQNYLMIDIADSFDSQISDWVSAVEQYINNFTGKDFEDSGSDETKYYDGSGNRELDIDDFTALTSVEILGFDSDDVDFTLTEGKANDYLTYPYNKTPYYRLILTTSASVGAWLSGKRRVKIVGRFRNSVSVPKDIELAATMLVGAIVERGLKGGSVISESLGDYSVTFRNIDEISSSMGVKEILLKHKVYEL